MELMRALDNHNRGVEAQNGAVEGKQVVADSHHFDVDQNPDLRMRTFVKVGSGWIRMRIKMKRVIRFRTKVMRSRNPVLVPALLVGGMFRV
jgi:hypothetical protein